MGLLYTENAYFFRRMNRSFDWILMISWIKYINTIYTNNSLYLLHNISILIIISQKIKIGSLNFVMLRSRTWWNKVQYNKFWTQLQYVNFRRSSMNFCSVEVIKYSELCWIIKYVALQPPSWYKYITPICMYTGFIKYCASKKYLKHTLDHHCICIYWLYAAFPSVSGFVRPPPRRTRDQDNLEKKK